MSGKKKTISPKRKVAKKPVDNQFWPAASSNAVSVSPVQQRAQGDYFNPYSWQNRGRFRPQPNIFNLCSSDEYISTSDRRILIGISRKLFSTMGEVSSAAKTKASWVVTGGFEPIYNGKNSDWATEATTFLKKWYSTCTNKGLSLDFRTALKVASFIRDRDGDLGMLFTQTKNGWPLIQFVAGHNIAQRSADDAVIKDGKYAGYKVMDGVVYADNGRPVAYCLVGDDKEDDSIISTTQLQLLIEPDFFDRDRGLPILSPALSDGLNLQEIDFYLTQVIKQESLIQIIETNEAGRSEAGDIVTFDQLGEGFSNVAPIVPSVPFEMVSEGNRFLKAGIGEKLESFHTNRPAQETQTFIKRIEKRLLQCLGMPHEVLLSPEDAGGAATRGIAEMVRKTILERQLLLEKYAKLAIVYALNTAMQNGIISENFEEDFTDWKFTRGPQLILDAGYERDADRKDYILGIKSMDDITRKYGKSATDVRTEVVGEVDAMLTDVEALQKRHPLFDINRCLDLVSQRASNPLPPVGGGNPANN